MPAVHPGNAVAGLGPPQAVDPLHLRFAPMKPKTIVLMVVAIVCGLGASYLTSRVLAEREDQQPTAPVVEKVTILVAKQQVNAQIKLVKPEEFFTEKQYVKE